MSHAATEAKGGAASPTRRWLGVVAGLSAVTIWAGWIVWTGPRVDAAHGPGFTPFDVALLRVAPPALLLAPFWLAPAMERGRPLRRRFAESVKPARTPWPILLMMFGWGAPFVLLAAHGLQRAEAPLMAALIPGAAPLYAAILGALVFGERPRGAALAAIGLIGAAAAIGLAAAPPAQSAGAAWFTAAAIGWAGYIVGFPRSGLRPLRAVGLLSAWSTAALLALWPLAPSNLSDIAAESVLTELLLQGVLAGALSIIAYTVALASAPALFSACLPASVPVLAAVFSALFLGTPPSAGQALGLGVATLGLSLLGVASFRARRRAAA